MTAPTPPAPTLAPGRVSVDAEAFAVLEAAFQRAAGAGSDWEWKAEAVDELLWPAYDAMQATARPLPAAPVAAMTEAEARALVAEHYNTSRTCEWADADRQRGYNLTDKQESADEDNAAAGERIIAALTATLAAPIAGTFEDMVDAFEHATCEMNELVASTRDDRRERIHRAHEQARLALMDAHAAEVAAAYALGASVEREANTCACGEPLGEMCYACNDDAREIDADPPALVNGGPPTDALDDGR